MLKVPGALFDAITDLREYVAGRRERRAHDGKQ